MALRRTVDVGFGRQDVRSDRRVRDVEVVFDQPEDADHRGRGPEAAGLPPDVWRLRHAAVTGLDDGHGSAVEAIELLAPHREHPDGAFTSALLICTHRRFAHCSRTLMRELETSGVLDATQLDELAEVLLWQARLRFAVPAGWIGTELEVAPGTRVRATGRTLVVPAPDEQTFPHAQHIPAPARRWAARRLLERDRTEVDAVLARTCELETGAGGAVLSGVLDAWASCPPASLETAVHAALASGLASVRLRALDVLARTGRREEAEALAHDDGAAQVRRWQPPADRHADDPHQPTLLG